MRIRVVTTAHEVVPAAPEVNPHSLLLLAADLVEHCGPREEKRAIELIARRTAGR